MTYLFETEVVIFGWIFAMLFIGLRLTFWGKSSRGKGIGEDRKTEIPSLSGIPYLMTYIKLLINYRCDSSYYLKPIDHLPPALKGIANVFHKEKIAKVAWGGRSYVMCFGSGICENIFNNSAAIKKDPSYEIFHHWLGTGLITSEGEKWRIRRKLLTPAFHFSILKDFLLIFNEQSNILVGKLRKVNGQEIDILDAVSLCALDVIGESAMGVRLGAQGDGTSAYVQAIKNVTSIMVWSFVTPWYWVAPIFNLSSAGKAMRTNLSVIHNFARKVIQGRKAVLLEEMENHEEVGKFQEDGGDVGVKKRKAFLDLLLYHHITNGSLSMEDMREEVDTFTFAGQDTTTAGISWALYLLGLHKDIQEKVYREVLEIFGDDKERSLTTEDLKEMKYLECVIKETLRLFPPVPFIMRRTTEDIKTGDYIIPANSSVMIFIYAIHHDVAAFPNPEAFDPDRFLPENCIGRHPFAYVPFSAGPRNCMGQRYAMLEQKTLLSKIIRNFKIHSLDQRDKIILAGDIILRPRNGLRLIFEKR